MEYLARTFGARLSGGVLDVGCDVCSLRELLPGVDYTGIDFGGTPDLRVDLEATPRLPFSDAEFDSVVCSEVLEHLDHLHRTFGELVRVAGRQVLISLPNCWAAARKRMRTGRGHIGHYGLPAEPPADRHKWFFSFTEGRDFAVAMGERHRLRIDEMRVTEKPRNPLLRAGRRLLHPRRDDYDNLFVHSLWVLYAK